MPTYKKQLVITLVLAGIGISSYAQFGGGMGSSGGMRRGRGADTSQSSRLLENTGRAPSGFEQISSSLYNLRMRLLITPEQSPAWESFRASVLDLGISGALMRPNVDEQTALQAVQSQNDWAKNRAVQSEKLLAASTLLFEVLTPDQLQLINQLLPKMLSDMNNGGDQRTVNRSFSR